MATEALTLTDLAVVLTVAAVALLLFYRLRQPMVLGYLVAGLLVGPSGPLPFGSVAPGSVETLAEIGILFIMLSLGLEFTPRKLRQLGAAPVGAALLQILLCFTGTRLLLTHLGFGGMEALFIAAAVSVSSTIVVVRVLSEAGALNTPAGRLAVGVLLVEDLVTIVFLGVVEGSAVTGTLQLHEARPVLLGLVAFTIVALVAGAVFVPRIIHFAAAGSKELLLVAVLGLVFAVSLLADHFGFSIALGAFITGAVVAESRVVHQAEHLVEPLKHMFTAVFFVSVGMLIDLGDILLNWRLVAILSVIVVLARIIGIGGPAFLFGYPPREGARAGAAMGQIGEFSFIIVASGVALGAVGPNVLAVVVGVASVTTLLSPYLVKATPWIVSAFAWMVPAPLRTYAEYYTGWVQNLGEAEETRRHRTRELALVRRLGLNAVGLVAIGALSVFVDRVLADTVLDLGGREVPAAWAVWPVVAIVAFPFLIAVWSALRELAVEVILELVPDRVAEQPEPPIALKVVRASLGLVLALALGFVAIAFSPTVGEGGALLVPAAIGVVFLAGVLFWRRIQSMHAHVEGAIENLFGVQRTTAERDEVLRLIGRHYTVSLQTENVTLPEGSPVAHHQIRDSQIRNRSGATIVSIERGQHRYVNPSATMLLLPGDRILLMGEAHHITKAKQLLMPVRHDAHATVDKPEPRRGQIAVREVVLRPDAAVSGHSIAQLALRSRSGASIVAAIRGADHIQNPTPNFTLQPADRLFLIGTSHQLDAAEALLRARAAAPAVAPSDPPPPKAPSESRSAPGVDETP